MNFKVFSYLLVKPLYLSHSEGVSVWVFHGIWSRWRCWRADHFQLLKPSNTKHFLGATPQRSDHVLGRVLVSIQWSSLKEEGLLFTAHPLSQKWRQKRYRGGHGPHTVVHTRLAEIAATNGSQKVTIQFLPRPCKNHPVPSLSVEQKSRNLKKPDGLNNGCLRGSDSSDFTSLETLKLKNLPFQHILMYYSYLA